MIRIFFIYIIILLSSFCSVAQLNSVLSLNGNWQILFDPGNIGIEANWMNPATFMKQDEVRNIQVPSCWEGKKIERLHTGGDLLEVEMDALPFGAELHSRWDALGGWASKSHIVTDHPVFKGLPTEMIMHGVYENVHPKTSMSKQKGTYIAGEIGYDHFPRLDIMVRHYNGPDETWGAADVLEAEIGKGKMLLSTLDIITNLGKDPVAEIIFFNMIEFAENR